MSDQQPLPPMTTNPGLNGGLGVLLLVLAVWPLSNTNETSLFTAIGIGLVAAGLYLVGAGAVARGVLMSRRHPR